VGIIDIMADRPRYLFVTGRLAEFALRQVLDRLAPEAGFVAEVAVLPITVAALMTPRWVARHLQVPPGIGKVFLPGYCAGDLGPVQDKASGVPVERGPVDLADLPRYFGHPDGPPSDYGAYQIEILAEINHASRLSIEELLGQASLFRAEGADVIDLGCNPGSRWEGVKEAVSALREEGFRISIDSFDPGEVADAAEAGAELVLSVDSSNRERAVDWGVEVVAIPDRPGTLDGIDETVAFLERRGIPLRIDPIVEPIGFGFASSLGRYLEIRKRYPEAAIMMGVGNLTELTDVDSAGVNTLLIGFCEELKIRSVLTTAVINWARSSVREIDLARRLVHYAVTRRRLPKHVEPRLVALRDPEAAAFGTENIAELQRRIRDPNWRMFAEGGLIHALNNEYLLSDTDPYRLFDQMGVRDASHAFYLGYEMMKARTALTLSKTYRQDQALEWGFLTVPEMSHVARRKAEANTSSSTVAEGSACEINEGNNDQSAREQA
jgi:dihydropteroate synthase